MCLLAPCLRRRFETFSVPPTPPPPSLQVQSAISTALVGRTALVIAHRLSTIRHADNIIVMKDGEVSLRVSVLCPFLATKVVVRR
jgi:hypothetical protein